MLYLRDIEEHTVDLKKSAIDWKTSDPEKGIYKFAEGKRVYYRCKNAAGIHEWWLAWCPDDPMTISIWRNSLKFDFVRPQDKEFWPEGIEPNEEGLYKFGDVVLMKCKTSDYIARKNESQQIAEERLRSVKRRFPDMAKIDGAALTDEEQAELEEQVKAKLAGIE